MHFNVKMLGAILAVVAAMFHKENCSVGTKVTRNATDAAEKGSAAQFHSDSFKS
jgi:hypothetical protein